MSDNDASRTFHGTSGSYYLPNDQEERDRLDYQYRAVNRMMHDQPTHAPVASPKRILDIGCGTGAMTIHLAEKFPQADDVIGLDLSPVRTTDVPANVRFMQGDFNALTATPDSNVLPAASFDYVVDRLLLFGMVDWPGYVRRAASLLAPGGWLELQETDTAMRDDQGRIISDSWRWLNEQTEAFAKRGLDLHVGSKVADYMRAAGLVDVQVKEFRWVVGHWEGHPETDMLGAYTVHALPRANKAALNQVFASVKSPEEIADLVKEMEGNFASAKDGTHAGFYVTYGRKP